MAEFILVHGSWQAPWCWREVAPTLRSMGHRVATPCLPGHGDDRTPLESVTFDRYVDCTVAAAEAAAERPILVGHSMAGAIVGRAAELIPDRIRALVCIASLIPTSGSSLMSLVTGFDPEYLAQILFSPDGRTAVLTPAGVTDFFGPECAPGVLDSVLLSLTDEPVGPYQEAIVLTDGNFGRTPRHFIECLRDRIVPLDQQRSIQRTHGFHQVHSLDTDHAAYFSRPAELAALLHRIAESS